MAAQEQTKPKIQLHAIVRMPGYVLFPDVGAIELFGFQLEIRTAKPVENYFSSQDPALKHLDAGVFDLCLEAI